MAVLVDELPHAAFTMLRNCWLRDARVSYKAKGLLGYLRSHAAGYRCSQAQMVRESDDGRAAVRAALDELETAGYLERIPVRDGGRYAETDYRMRDPFDATGNLSKTDTPPASDTLKTVQGRKSDMVTVSDFPTREIAPLEEQREETNQLTLVEPSASTTRPTEDALFDEFWKGYPKKVGKKGARKAWDKATRTTSPDKIIEIVRVYPFRSELRYVKDPVRWLTEACWEDDLDSVAAARQATGPKRSFHLDGRDGYDVGDGTF